MSSNIQQEIKQTRPFASSRQEALVALLRTTDQVKRHMAGVLAGHKITIQQYNVLRILRGAQPDGLPTMEIRDRMLEVAPGITRLIDRLENRGLVERCPLAVDRRCVVCRITASGLDLLANLDGEVALRDAEVLESLTQTEVQTLISLLDQIRGDISK
jgi:DNA-binding MarR family transcriptional regulator